MTTAHRPTFDPARGKEAARGEAYHQRLLPAHKTLKFRQAAQGTPGEQAKRDLKAELLKKERAYYAKKDGRALPEDEDEDEEPVERKAIEAGSEAVVGGTKRKMSDTAGDAPAEGEEEEDYETKKRRVLAETKDIDADSSSSSSSESDSDDSDSEDEEASIMRELAKIKAERAEVAAKQAAAQAAKDEEAREKEIAYGNPLLNGQKAEYGVKRRWDDDVVFKNQARGQGEREKGEGKRFVNDLLRSDFHRRFMDKYVR